MPTSPFDLIEDDIGTVMEITLASYFGRHDGLNNAAVLTDTSADWVRNEFVDRKLRNITDGSSTTITANTETTITGALTGGTDNDWDARDEYEIPVDITGGTLTWHWQHGKKLPVTKTGTIVNGANGITGYTTVANDIEAEDLRVKVEADLPSGWHGRSDTVNYKVDRLLKKGL